MSICKYPIILLENPMQTFKSWNVVESCYSTDSSQPCWGYLSMVGSYQQSLLIMILRVLT